MGKRQKILTSNLKITDESTNYISPTQKFQFAFPYNNYGEDGVNFGGTDKNGLSHVSGKLTYGSSQKLKNHFGTEIAPEKNIPDDTRLVNSAEEKGESTSAFRKR